MGTIKNLVADIPIQGVIPLPSVSGQTLLLIHQLVQGNRIASRVLRHRSFLDLLEACVYLDYKPLFYRLLPQWINKRPFPGSAALRDSMVYAIYFLKDTRRLNALHVPDSLKIAVRDSILCHGRVQWRIPLAAENGHVNVLRVLLRNKSFDPGVSDNYAIRWASRHGHLKVVKLLLQDKRVEPDHTAITWAARGGHLDVIICLLQDERAELHADYDHAIWIATERGHVDVVNYLQENTKKRRKL